jgi:hypothetical protein
MPAEYRVGSDQPERLAPLGPDPKKKKPHDAIRRSERESFSIAALKGAELVSESQDLHL